MPRENPLSRELLIDEFLDCIRQRAESDHRGRLDQAFVDWYVEAEFGRKAQWKSTDDAGDGGIDAVVTRPGERPPVVIIQSKFSERVGRGMLGARAYAEFDRVVDTFHSRDGDEFAAFLGEVREDARNTYRAAFRQLRDVNQWLTERHAFRVITTLKPRPGQRHPKLTRGSYIHVDEILELYRLYRKGHTPRPADLSLTIAAKLPYKDPVRRVESYLTNVRLSDFRKYFEHSDVARLVARNIRYNVAGRIGKTIRKSYEDTPHDFWYFHNGITIICDHFSQKGTQATLTNPSVINGAQTLYAISSSAKPNATAMVTVRIIVRGRHLQEEHEDDQWVQKVIRGVNTQNRVRNQDFRSNEPEQLELQQLFRDQSVFYERKRGEFREYRNDPRFRRFDRTSIRNIGMALTAVSQKDGVGVVLVKRGVEEVFEEDNYKRLFPSRIRMGREFKQIYFAYRLANFVGDSAFRGYGTRKFRHAYWSAVWLAYQGITAQRRFFTNATMTSIREGFDELESRSRVGMRGRAEMKRLRTDIWRAWRGFNKKDRDRWTAVNFFKSKPAHKKLATSVLPKHRAGLKTLADALL
jgi:hypothetical protein